MIKTKRCAPDRGTDKKRGLKSPRGFAAAHLVKAIYFLEDLQPLGHGCPEAVDFSPLSRTAQSADLFLPIITQGFNPGGPALQKTTKHHKKRQKTFTLKSAQAFLSLCNLWRKALHQTFLTKTEDFSLRLRVSTRLHKQAQCA